MTQPKKTQLRKSTCVENMARFGRKWRRAWHASQAPEGARGGTEVRPASASLGQPRPASAHQAGRPCRAVLSTWRRTRSSGGQKAMLMAVAGMKMALVRVRGRVRVKVRVQG